MNDQQTSEITSQIIASVKDVLGDKWNEAKDFAESESKKFAKSIAEIALWKETGKIEEDQAKVLLRMHQRSMKMVLTALEGISLVLAEKAINSVVDAIRGVVNGLIGWDVL